MMRCYLIPELLIKLQMNRRQFSRLRLAGKLPFLEELLPRLDQRPRYRADLVDAYLAGKRPMLRAVLPRRQRAG